MEEYNGGKKKKLNKNDTRSKCHNKKRQCLTLIMTESKDVSSKIQNNAIKIDKNIYDLECSRIH